MAIKAIPTTYRGVEFRSRLEAKWAIMFDLLDWQWEYEPIDLDGYIPDFILLFEKQQILVEVKPALTLDELHDAVPKIDQSGWEEEVLIVGGRIFYNDRAIGIMRDREWGAGDYNLARHFWCRDHDEVGFCDEIYSYRCRVCGCHDGDHHMHGGASSKNRLLDAWTTASNTIKYRHGKR